MADRIFGRPVISAYQPSLRDRLADAFLNLAGRNYGTQRFARQLLGSAGIGKAPGISAIDVTPAGVPLQLEEGGADIGAGRPVTGAANIGLAMVPIPAAAKVAKGVGGKVVRGILGTPDLRKMSTQAAIEAAQNAPHLIPSPSGGFVGGPSAAKSMDDLLELRAKFDADVLQGLPAAGWYRRARDFNREVAGPDPARQRLFAHEQAFWSPQTDPDPNLGAALKGHNAYEMGAPLAKVRTTRQGGAYRAARDAGVDLKQGQKTGVYAQHLDPTLPFATTGTNDFRHARAMGYTDAEGNPWSAALSEQQHRFMDYETMLAVDRANKAKLGGRSDWEAHEIQSAPWVVNKSKSPADIARAARTYPDYADKYTGFGTYELRPGAATGHLPGVDPQAFESAGWTDGEGRDAIYDALGFYQRPTQDAQGFYQGTQGLETNPAHVARPLVSFDQTGQGPVLDEASRSGMDAAEGFRAYMDAQEAGAWHKPVLNAQAGQSGSVFIPQATRASPESLQALSEAGARAGLPDVTDTGQGITMTQWWPSPQAPVGPALRGDLGADIGAILPGSVPQRAKVDSSLIDYSDPWGSGENGAVTRAMLDIVGHPNAPAALGKLDASPELRQMILAKADRDAALSAATGSPLNAAIQNARRIFASEGFAGLRRALVRGEVLPAAALPFFNPLLLEEQANGADNRP